MLEVRAANLGDTDEFIVQKDAAIYFHVSDGLHKGKGSQSAPQCIRDSGAWGGSQRKRSMKDKDGL